MSMQRHQVASTLTQQCLNVACPLGIYLNRWPSRLICLLIFCHDITSTLMRRCLNTAYPLGTYLKRWRSSLACLRIFYHDVASTLLRRCLNVMYPLCAYLKRWRSSLVCLLVFCLYLYIKSKRWYLTHIRKSHILFKKDDSYAKWLRVFWFQGYCYVFYRASSTLA